MPIIVPPDRQIWQGDIFAEVPWSVVRSLDFVRADGSSLRFVSIPAPPAKERARLVTHSGRDFAMLLTHECVVDKQGRAPVSFARILPITIHDAQGQNAIRCGANYQTFYLPSVEDLIPESYVDFRLVVAIDPEVFRFLTRVASLTTEGRSSLRQRLVLYWTRHELATRPSQLTLRVH